MEPTTAATAQLSTTRPPQSNAFADLGSEDFFKLLITQLTNQDPLEPTGNEELLKQIASIRDIELSTTLTDSLRDLTGRQDVGSAASLIGRHVTGLPGSDGLTISGVVSGVRFEPSGKPVLILASGAELPLEQVSAIQPAFSAAEALIGRLVQGIDRSDPADPRAVQGLVTAVQADSAGEILLELDTGDRLRFRDVVSTAA